jgi:hypothetical protein
MSITQVNNIFSQEDIDILNDGLFKCTQEIHPQLGRIAYEGLSAYLYGLTDNTIGHAITKNIKNFTGVPLDITSITCVEYSNLYGKPNLPPHLDADKTDLIMVVQLESNTDWDIGLNCQVYKMKDNYALIFNPNKEVHWRVHKEFKDGEYVRMLFVRFRNLNSTEDYAGLSINEMDYPEVCKFRDNYDPSLHTL